MEPGRAVEVAVALLVVVCILGIAWCYATYEHRPAVPVDRYPWNDTPVPTTPATAAHGNASATAAPAAPPAATAPGP
jgi:hypothetical protein